MRFSEAVVEQVKKSKFDDAIDVSDLVTAMRESRYIHVERPFSVNRHANTDGSRCSHCRIQCALEDAGIWIEFRFISRDIMIGRMCWIDDRHLEPGLKTAISLS